jgi:1-deoxy-D-xylulose-5-phosphate synthase
MMATAFALEGPVAVRYPRGMGAGAAVDPALRPLALGEAEMLKPGKDAAIIAVGSRVLPALEAAQELEEAGLGSVAVCNARFVKPLPGEQILSLARRHKKLLLVEENALAGGFGSAVLELLADHDLLSGRTVRRQGLPDAFVEHGSQKELRELTGLDKSGIKKALAELF